MNSNVDKYLVSNCAAIILAAGQSSRLGSPKQLLSYKGKNLLQHTIDVARQASLHPVIVVLGSGYEAVINGIDITGIHIVNNNDWQTGMASSIRCGIQALQDIIPIPDATILMVCDQPFVTPSLLNKLLSAQHSTGKPIVASKYEDTIGTPALFHQSFFPQLLELTGDSGDKKIMLQYQDQLMTVPFPLGDIDIDTTDDYKSLEK